MARVFGLIVLILIEYGMVATQQVATDAPTMIDRNNCLTTSGPTYKCPPPSLTKQSGTPNDTDAMSPLNASDHVTPEPRAAPTRVLTPADIAYGTLGVIGTLDNAVSALVFSRLTDILNPSAKLLLMHQSVVDSLWALTMAVQHFGVLRDRAYLLPNSIFGDIVCEMFTSSYLFWSFSLVSVLTMLLIALDRFLCVTRPLWYKSVQKSASGGLRSVAGFVLLLLWLVSFVVNAGGIYANQMLNGSCTFKPFSWYSSYARAHIVMRFIIPTSVLIALYAIMFLKLSAHLNAVMDDTQQEPPHPLQQAENSSRGDGERRQPTKRSHGGARASQRVRPNGRRQKRLVFMISCLLCSSFVVCFAPNQIFFFYFSLGGKVKLGTKFHRFSVALLNINCVINPFIFFLTVPQYKKMLKVLMMTMCGRKVDSEENSATTMSNSISNTRPRANTNANNHRSFPRVQTLGV